MKILAIIVISILSILCWFSWKAALVIATFIALITWLITTPKPPKNKTQFKMQ